MVQWGSRRALIIASNLSNRNIDYGKRKDPKHQELHKRDK